MLRLCFTKEYYGGENRFAFNRKIYKGSMWCRPHSNDDQLLWYYTGELGQGKNSYGMYQ